jgi:3'(2'), 5'-bisphosphate nucleotidase
VKGSSVAQDARRELPALAEAFGALAVLAAVPVMEIYERGCQALVKPDGSPVTEADQASEAILLDGLAHLVPDCVVVAEEACAAHGYPQVGDRFILVDPLDGTREFLGRNGEFTVNVALIEAGVPVCGAVYAPASNRLWIGALPDFAQSMSVSPGSPLPGAGQRRPIRVRPAPDDGIVAMVSRSHLDHETRSYVSRFNLRQLVAAGSSVKFCLIAEGMADLYPRFSVTSEWDTAAGDAVLRAAGGHVLAVDGTPLRYGKRAAAFRNPAFVACGDPALLRI